jgi:hypothetical protein
MSIVGDIINTHRSSQGLEPLNNVKQFLHIEKHNSSRQGVIVVDPREALRVKWLTYLSQKKNHERWEETCVELGFAKLPVDEEEEARHGHIVFPEEQFARLLQFDEMKLSMNGCNQEIGGRPSCSHTNPELPEAGKSAQKSSKRMTVMAGINFAREALPLYFLIPTDAKEPQVKREFLLALPQVEGQYGFEGRRVVNCGWTFNKKGGMNGVAFNAWYNDWLKSLYPNAKDVPGKRILDKSDSGPGRFGEAFNSRARLDGFYHFPSTPNATEVCQEMDQLFSYFKSLVYKNINTVLSKKKESFLVHQQN